MEQITVQDLTIRFSENINYVWALFSGPVDNEGFIQSLDDAGFHAALKEKDTINLLLDCTRIGTFSIPNMSDYLDGRFMGAMDAAGIEKISVIVDGNVLYMMKFVFQGIEDNHADDKTAIRFFNEEQFQQSAEAVEWFN